MNRLEWRVTWRRSTWKTRTAPNVRRYERAHDAHRFAQRLRESPTARDIRIEHRTVDRWQPTEPTTTTDYPAQRDV